MIKKIIILSASLIFNAQGMSKFFVMKCSQKQALKLAKGMSTQLFGADLKNILMNCVSNISASRDRNQYIITFDLTEEVNHDNKTLKEIVKFMAEEEIDDKSW